MNLGLRVLLAVGSAVGITVVSVVPIALVAARWGPGCPPDVEVCDLPGMGAFGAGVMLSPLVGLVAGWITFRRLGSSAGESPETVT
jgi:hypothetical protein